MVYAGGNLPPDPAHSAFEALAARGFYAEAAEAYRSHLVANPKDHGARLKLAELYRAHLNDPERAERLYLEIRRGQPSPKEDRLAANLLIELYRFTGRRERLIVELARFADQWKGTRAGQEAARALKELKEEMRDG
jgi:tetratricopeptide (TPR) repeat protein